MINLLKTLLLMFWVPSRQDALYTNITFAINSLHVEETPVCYICSTEEFNKKNFHDKTKFDEIRVMNIVEEFNKSRINIDFHKNTVRFLIKLLGNN